MRFFYDCEFLEDGETIGLISIGIVAENGREYYAVNRDFRWRRIAHRTWYAPWRWTTKHEWLAANVVPSLPRLHGDAILHYGNSGPLGRLDWQSPLLKPLDRIADEVRIFLLSEGEPELWAYYGAYDHVTLAQLWGPMVKMPDGLPYWTNDIRQWQHQLGIPSEQMPQQAAGEHNALEDARHNKRMWEWLEQAAHGPGVPR